MQNREFLPNDFELIARDEHISDKKLETKPTTFFKDALRRFRKNKASVAGGIIIGIIIILAITVPVLSPHNIDKVSTKEIFLAPKLFNVGTGFWDGTRDYERLIYDTENQVPAFSERYSVDALKQSLTEIHVDEDPTYIDSASEYGYGGYVVFEADVKKEGEDKLLFSKSVTLNTKDGYTLNVTFGDDEDVSGGKLGEYAIILITDDETGEGYLLRDYSKDYSDFSIDLSEMLTVVGLNEVKGRIGFVVRSSADAKQYILIRNLVLSANDSAKNKEELAEVSFEDANQMVLNADTKSTGYWACTGRKGVHDCAVYYCDFTVDTYMLVYGDADKVTYTKTELERWIEAGWCEYDASVGPESFKVLSDECPIDHVVDQQINSRTKKLSSITGVGWNYKKMGYKEMPRFIMGTDANGYDLFKKAFAGLRTSLILGVCVAVFCFCFGLVWGSISGYFGGWADLLMERFTDILGSVPWIVIMTLAILHLGNNFFTFFLALCIVDWMGTAHLTRTQFYRFKGREYVLASRTLGSSNIRLIFRHILPNGMGTIITSSAFMITSVIYSEASIAYLNLGLQGLHSFGVMMAGNQQYLGKYPYLVIFPAVVMSLLMISFNLFSNGLRDAFNPSLKGSE